MGVLAALFSFRLLVLLLVIKIDMSLEFVYLSQSAPGNVLPSKMRAAAGNARSASVLLSITYLERVAVPRGSTLLINISDPIGKPQGKPIRTKTKTIAPPYEVKVPLPHKGDPQVWVLDITLESRVGHRFSKKEIVKSEALADQNKVEVTLELN